MPSFTEEINFRVLCMCGRNLERECDTDFEYGHLGSIHRVKVLPCPDCLTAQAHTNSIAPDPVEAEYREAAQAHGEADIEFELCSCDAAAAVDCPHWNATVRTRVRLIAARAARDAR